MKWKGTEITELSDDALRDVHERALRILAEINQEMSARKLWMTNYGNEVQRTAAPKMLPPDVRTPGGVSDRGDGSVAVPPPRTPGLRRAARSRRTPKP